ncbi:MAG: ATP-binding protein [Chloroflexi bacterium]|nr:ATP-binding protein [Chloroflexota bacterium]MYD48411.1 ATP-binding protein [Chloroflexota bacterium]
MTSAERKIAFKIEFSRILELLADEIYQSPLALLRENTQNAFDAIRMREPLGHGFDPAIQVRVDAQKITVSDNGIGMTPQDVESNFWHAGRSGKNTAEARAAGVVGTFGIGAMANFGVAEKLTVESESAITGERTSSSVLKSDLSTDFAGISVTSIPSTGEAGTIVTAEISRSSRHSVQDALTYLRDFVEFVDIPVYFNGENISGAKHRAALPSERSAWSEHIQDVSIAGILSGNLDLLGMASGELRVVVEDIESANGLGKQGAIVLAQGRNATRALRSGFGLATTGFSSIYQWGGIADLPFLKPTAGREALDDSSNQLLQQIFTALDNLVSPLAAEHAESFNNDGFLRWVASNRQFNLCGPLEITIRPSSETESLSSAIGHGGVQYYSGRDESIVATYASEETPLIVLSRRAPRRDCELGYLNIHGVREVDVTPRVTEQIPMDGLSFAHSALATRIARILEEDYFLGTDIRFGSISGGLPVLVTDAGTPVVMYLDPSATSIAPLIALYRDDYNAFAPFVKDFVRATIFPRISKLVPSSTREGAEAFLRHLRSNREWFEYELDDKADLEEILDELQAGRMTVVEATRRLTDSGRSFLEVSRAGAELLSSVVSEIEEGLVEDLIPDPLEARPAIDRREDNTEALILTSEVPVNGYTCFLALSDRVQGEKGKFFLQPHTTEVVWGGRKVLFIFQHHSGRFGLYYDILCPGLVGGGSGGGPRGTSTILTKDRTFIPIPQDIVGNFLPNAGERIRLEVRCDILYLGQDYDYTRP